MNDLYMLVDADDGIAEVGSYEKCKRLYDRWKQDWKDEWSISDVEDIGIGIKLAIVKVVKSYDWKEEEHVVSEVEVNYD